MPPGTAWRISTPRRCGSSPAPMRRHGEEPRENGAMPGSATLVKPTIFKGMGPASGRVPEARRGRRLPENTVVVSADNHWSISEDIFYQRFPAHLKDAAPKLYRSP